MRNGGLRGLGFVVGRSLGDCDDLPRLVKMEELHYATIIGETSRQNPTLESPSRRGPNVRFLP